MQPQQLQVPKIGESWPGQGGFYAGIIRDVKTGQQWHLIDSGITVKTEWGERGEEIEGANDFTDGAANTAALIASGKHYPAAKACAELELDGHNDYYLPAQKELNLLYINLQDKCEQKWHWSSTQYSACHAWDQDFSDGDQCVNGKDYELAVRAVRRILAI